MLFEQGGYEPPSKKPCPGPESDVDQGPLDCTKSDNAIADLRIRQVRIMLLLLNIQSYTETQIISKDSEI